MSGPTVHQLKRALEEIRDELTEATTHGSGNALVWPLGCDILANSPTVLTMLANKLAEQPPAEHRKPSFGDVAATLRFLVLSSRCEAMPTVELRFKSERDLCLFLREELRLSATVIGRDPEAALREGFTWAGIHFKLVGGRR